MRLTLVVSSVLAGLGVALAAAYWWMTTGPRSFQAAFDRDVDLSLASPSMNGEMVAESDLASLPDPVRRYLRATGVMGRPKVVNYRLRFRGRIRSAPDTPWMTFEADQHSFTNPPRRYFLMRAWKSGIPVHAFHRLADGHAAMQVKIAGAFSLVDARGEDMDRSETVTLFNDMCLLAPGTLLDRRITWEAWDARSARARFTHGHHTISATLWFGDDGLLTNFISDDRSRAAADGRTFTRLRFSTPVRDYRDFGFAYLASHGDARWTLPDGEFTYGEFDLQSVGFNVRR